MRGQRPHQVTDHTNDDSSWMCELLDKSMPSNKTVMTAARQTGSKSSHES